VVLSKTWKINCFFDLDRFFSRDFRIFFDFRQMSEIPSHLKCLP
jgi:hypothetical protein